MRAIKALALLSNVTAHDAAAFALSSAAFRCCWPGPDISARSGATVRPLTCNGDLCAYIRRYVRSKHAALQLLACVATFTPYRSCRRLRDLTQHATPGLQHPGQKPSICWGMVSDPGTCLVPAGTWL